MLKISKQNNSPYSHRQKQLEKDNIKLQQQLKNAYQTISKLRNQVQQLRNQVKYLQLQNQKYNESSRITNNKQMRTSPKSKSNKSLKLVKDFHEQMEIFTSQSDSQTEDYSQLKPISRLILPLGGRQNSKYVSHHQDQQVTTGGISLLKQKSSQIKLRGKPSNERSLKKIDSTNLFHPVSYFDVDPDEDINMSGFLNKQSKSNVFSMKNINLYKSQKIINIGHNNNKQHIGSAIKQQSKIRSPQQQKIFKKVTIAKPIYEYFFVTGLSKQNQPQILYSYPGTSPHFEPILSLCYSDDFLKVKQNSSNSSNISINQSNFGNQSKIKDFYIVPLRKTTQVQTQNQRQYLIVCEVEQTVLIQKQNLSIPCTFQRLYCFISSCQFFNAFKNLINQFIDKINGIRSQQQNQLFKEQSYKRLLQECLQQPLMILSQKSAEANHTLNYRLDSYISIAIDIPSIQNSFKLVSQYRPWGVMNFKVQLRPVQDYISCLETKLFGVILAYALSEKKIILYSTIKSKISQCILHFLQIIRPLQYVCPIIMTSLKQEHQQYFSAPMSLLIGLWTQQKKMQRQKIQIFMNRKQNLAGMIEKGKISITDGIIINLDTGLIYGGGLSEQLSSLGLKINQYYENYCHHPKQVFKLFQKLFQKQTNKNQIQIHELKQRMKHCLEGTQLYMYYMERKNSKYNMP